MKPFAHFSARPQSFRVLPASGWTDVLVAELQSILATPLHRYKFTPQLHVPKKGGVTITHCDGRQGLEVLLRVATAHDVSWVWVDEVCESWAAANRLLRAVPWSAVLAAGSGLKVQVKCSGGFTDSSAGLREVLLKAANVGEQGDPALGVKVTLQGKRLRAECSLAGEPLYKRGYKSSTFALAPLPEHHAAACARWALTGLAADAVVSDVWVPFAGSGTLGFEALVVLSQVGPGAFERGFSAERCPGLPSATLNFIRRQLHQCWAEYTPPRVWMADVNSAAIAAIRENAQLWGHASCVEAVDGDVFTLPLPTPEASGHVLVLLNPPFGDRLGRATDITSLYRRLGGWLQAVFARGAQGVLGCCLCPDEDSWRVLCQALGQAYRDTRHINHGGLDIRVVRFQI